MSLTGRASVQYRRGAPPYCCYPSPKRLTRDKPSLGFQDTGDRGFGLRERRRGGESHIPLRFLAYIWSNCYGIKPDTEGKHDRDSSISNPRDAPKLQARETIANDVPQ